MKNVGGKRDEGHGFQIVACWKRMMDASDAFCHRLLTWTTKV
jgi:hypothetical protein